MSTVSRKYCQRLASKMVWVALWVVLLLFSGCSVKRNVPDGMMIVKKNKVKIDVSEVGRHHSISTSELKDYITLPENRSNRNMNVWAYNRKQTKFKKWVQNIIDNPPSYYSLAKAEQSEQRMEAFLSNKGYFRSQVLHSVKQKNNPKKAVVTYHVHLAKPYFVSEIDYNIPDSAIAQIITPAMFESAVKTGEQYDFYRLDDMRTKITDILRNSGYLFFNTDYVFYEIDSLHQNHTLKITLNIRPNYLLMSDEEAAADDLYNRVFYYQDVAVQPNTVRQRRSQIDTLTSDTISFRRPRFQHRTDSIDYSIIESQQPYIRYKALLPSIYLEPGDLYQERNLRKNQSLLAELSAINTCNIMPDTVSRALWPDTAHVGLLNARIDLTKSVQHNYSVGVEATNNMGAWGTSINLSYNNRNIFKGSELFSLQLKLATEIQSTTGGGNEIKHIFGIFNTLEGGIQASLTFPKFLAPFSPYSFRKFFRPKSTISIGYNFQKRPDYSRDIVRTSLDYLWKPDNTQMHKLTLLDINSVKIFKTEEFENKIWSYLNQRLLEQYSDHFIMALNYTFTYSTQEIGKPKNFIYLQAFAESSGNLLYAINSIAHSPKTKTDIDTDIDTDSHYTLFGIRYAQYLKGSLEFRRYRYVGKYNHIAYRAYFGIGVPYGNAVSLPFEKSFYAGGANDLRGWAINMVGPGTIEDDIPIERGGDLKMEFNGEFRFGISGFLKGALFTDIGNVWISHEEEYFSEGYFRFSEFYKQLYWDAGFGLRADFNFFIIRVDAAVPIYSPGSTYDTKWVAKKLQWSDVVLSFGIGYPF